MKGWGDHEKKKILMLTWEYPPQIIGGLARHVHALATELAAVHQQIHVVTSKQSFQSDYARDGRVHIHRVAPLNAQDPDFLSWIGGFNLAVIEEGLKLAKHVQFDLVHAHDWMTGPAAEFISKKLGIPLIATIHGTEYGRNKGIFSDLQQFIFKKENELCHQADEVIVCSDYMEDEVNTLFKVSKDRINVIPNGTRLEEKHNQDVEITEMYPFLTRKKLIFSMGRIVTEKGFDTLLSAAGLMRKHHDVCFVIAGNGPLLETYRDQASKLGLKDSVHFIGFVNETIRDALLMKADIAVFPSEYEPFGLAAAEALTAGVPTVLAKTGGMQDLIEDYKTGFYMQPGNEKDLALTLEWILENQTAAKEIARTGRMKVLERFSWAQNAKSTDSLYKKVLSNNHRRRVFNEDECLSPN
ncbi:glycosyltransferase family 4 protein [Cytobacillus oceanisediminis]|uniref:glycosyltransferase family 4 protein n=1 Tax=Cytobacillus oceanisediminis TaxID=665099 RepID=UPI00119FA18D|nr:glycosyltransferase family 4 protein [Cytobacillus oceanisediminis]